MHSTSFLKQYAAQTRLLSEKAQNKKAIHPARPDKSPFNYVSLLDTKNEMTLDCFILRSSSFFTNSDHPQSRVISVHS